MITLKNSFMLFVLIFIAYWLTESVNYILIQNAINGEDEIVIKFTLINLIAIFIITIFHIENRFLIEKKSRQELSKQSNNGTSLYQEVDNIISKFDIDLKEKITKITELLNQKLFLEETIVSIKNDTYLTIINLDDKTKVVFGNPNISLILNEHPIKKIISKEFNKHGSKLEFIKYNNKINNFYIYEILNIPILSNENEKIGLITVFIKNSKIKKAHLKNRLLKVTKHIAFAIQKSREESVDKLDKTRENLEDYIESNSLAYIYKYTDITKKISLESKRATRYKTKLSAILFSVEILQDFNHKPKEYESSLNSEIKLINGVKNAIRDVDFFGLWKKNKFIILLPQTDLNGAKIVASRIKEKIFYINQNKLLNLICNFSVTEFNENDDEIKFTSRLEKTLNINKSGNIIQAA